MIKTNTKNKKAFMIKPNTQPQTLLPTQKYFSIFVIFLFSFFSFSLFTFLLFNQFKLLNQTNIKPNQQPSNTHHTHHQPHLCTRWLHSHSSVWFSHPPFTSLNNHTHDTATMIRPMTITLIMWLNQPSQQPDQNKKAANLLQFATYLYLFFCLLL